MMTKGRDCVVDFLDGFLNTFSHGRPRSFGIRGSLAVAAPDPHRGGETVGNRLHLVLSLGPTRRIVESLCFVQISPNLLEPAFIFCFRLCVQHCDADTKPARNTSMPGDCCG